MEIVEVLMLAAIVVALFGARSWEWVDCFYTRRETKKILKENLEQLKKDLVRIRDERNSSVKRDNDKIFFGKTCISEISGYSFLFTDLLVPKAREIRLSRYIKTIKFFNHYRINVTTIESRYTESSQNSWLTLGSVNILIDYLEGAIREFS